MAAELPHADKALLTEKATRLVVAVSVCYRRCHVSWGMLAYDHYVLCDDEEISSYMKLIVGSVDHGGMGASEWYVESGVKAQRR